MVRLIYSEATRRLRMARGKTGEVVRSQFTGSLYVMVYNLVSSCSKWLSKIFFFLTENYRKKAMQDEEGFDGLGPNCLAFHHLSR